MSTNTEKSSGVNHEFDMASFLCVGMYKASFTLQRSIFTRALSLANNS